MGVQDNDTIVELLRSVLGDIRQLIRDELDLMRAEVREEVASARAAALAFGGAVFAALLGLAILCVALGSGIAYWFGWPAWIGYAIVALLLFAGAFIALVYGRKKMSRVQPLPKTQATLKENLTWIQTKSAHK
jgi:hypothetical protein